MTIKEVRKRTGLSQSQFAKKFDIPIRTLQSWECNQAIPKDYILNMMNQILDFEESTVNKA